MNQYLAANGRLCCWWPSEIFKIVAMKVVVFITCNGNIDSWHFLLSALTTPVF